MEVVEEEVADPVEALPSEEVTSILPEVEGDVYSVSVSDHATLFGRRILAFLQRECAVDVHLSIGGTTFGAHRVVLASFSGFFKEQLSLNPQAEAMILDEVYGLTAEHLRLVLSLMYYGRLDFGASEWATLVEALKLLEIPNEEIFAQVECRPATKSEPSATLSLAHLFQEGASKDFSWEELNPNALPEENGVPERMEQAVDSSSVKVGKKSPSRGIKTVRRPPPDTPAFIPVDAPVQVEAREEEAVQVGALEEDQGGWITVSSKRRRRHSFPKSVNTAITSTSASVAPPKAGAAPPPPVRETVGSPVPPVTLRPFSFPKEGHYVLADSQGRKLDRFTLDPTRNLSLLFIGGLTVSALVKRIADGNPTPRPLLKTVTVLVGGNDLGQRGHGNIRRLCDDLSTLTSLLRKAAPAAKLHVLDVLPRTDLRVPLDQAREALTTWARCNGVTIVRVSSLTREDFGSDGILLNDCGIGKLTHRLKQRLRLPWIVEAGHQVRRPRHHVPDFRGRRRPGPSVQGGQRPRAERTASNRWTRPRYAAAAPTPPAAPPRQWNDAVRQGPRPEIWARHEPPATSGQGVWPPLHPAYAGAEQEPRLPPAFNPSLPPPKESQALEDLALLLLPIIKELL
jgi:hypothetical protein